MSPAGESFLVYFDFTDACPSSKYLFPINNEQLPLVGIVSYSSYGAIISKLPVTEWDCGE